MNWKLSAALLGMLVFVLCSQFSILYSSPQQTTLNVDVNLVSVFATVLDARGEFVRGLNRDDFRVYDDGVEQKISVFETDDRVESAVAVLIDSSGSMVDTLGPMKKGTLEFVRLSPRTDDFCVFTFGTSARLLQDFGGTVGSLETRLNNLRANGKSVFFDALVTAMKKLDERSQPRKALIALTDGGFDNGSVAGFKTVTDRAQRSGTLLYFVAIGPTVLMDQHTLESLTSLVGGRVAYLSQSDSIPAALTAIRSELSRQYFMGYYLPHRPGPHTIRVETPGRNLRVRSKSGYSDPPGI